MPKTPIWLDDTSAEIALGFIGEILAEELSTIDRKVLSDIYEQLSPKQERKETDNHYAVEIESTSKHLIYLYAPDKEVAQLQACRAVLYSFKNEQAPWGKIWSHTVESNFTPNKIVSSIREIQG
jgi:hypothetical protein